MLFAAQNSQILYLAPNTATYFQYYLHRYSLRGMLNLIKYRDLNHHSAILKMITIHIVYTAFHSKIFIYKCIYIIISRFPVF